MHLDRKHQSVLCYRLVLEEEARAIAVYHGVAPNDVHDLVVDDRVEAVHASGHGDGVSPLVVNRVVDLHQVKGARVRHIRVMVKAAINNTTSRAAR